MEGKFGFYFLKLTKGFGCTLWPVPIGFCGGVFDTNEVFVTVTLLFICGDGVGIFPVGITLGFHVCDPL